MRCWHSDEVHKKCTRASTVVDLHVIAVVMAWAVPSMGHAYPRLSFREGWPNELVLA